MGNEDTPDYWVHVYAAKTNATLPTIFFVSGFGADAPVFGYSDLLTKIASKGYVIVGVDRLSIPSYPKEARRFVDVLAWAKNGSLKQEMAKKGLAATPDLDSTVVMAQSAGNHIVGQALADDCMYAKAFVMIDPVDGLDPFGIVKSEDLIHPGTKLNFTTPAIILDNGLDPTGGLGGVSCAPLALGSPRWYNAWAGPIWHVNATAYGHVDCLDDAMISIGHLVCPSNKKSDKNLYRQHLADTAALFIEGLLDNKQDNFALLEDASHFPVDVILQHDRKGMTPIRPGCVNHHSMAQQFVV